jgi:hypothetical protein
MPVSRSVSGDDPASPLNRRTVRETMNDSRVTVYEQSEALVSTVLQQALGQVLALLAFFGFPMFQYVLLRRIARQEAKPELWYLPAYGFRLVIRNLPRRKTLTNIHYRAIVRRIVARRPGASVATFDDVPLLEREDFFLFPGTDQILVTFGLAEATQEDAVVLKKLSKLGEVESEIILHEKDRLICDYSANIENFFNFDVAVARRVEVTGASLKAFAAATSPGSPERRFPVDRVRSVT